MPHHSKQQKPPQPQMPQFVGPNSSVNINTRHSFPPQPPPQHANNMMIPSDRSWPPGAPQQHHPSPTTTLPPYTRGNAGAVMQQQQQASPHFHRVPQSPSEGAKPVMQHASLRLPKAGDSNDDAVPPPPSFVSKDRELGASVLLLAAVATEESARIEQQQLERLQQQQQQQQESSGSDSVGVVRPLKKRKTKPAAAPAECLSPNSTANETCTTAASTPQRHSGDITSVESHPSSRSMSYDDVKDDEEHDEGDDNDDHHDENENGEGQSEQLHTPSSAASAVSAASSTAQDHMIVHQTRTKPPVLVCHQGGDKASLPSMLYWLMTDTAEPTSYVRTIIQWLPHGQAWRIVRIDGLRRLIIPQFFTECLLEDGTASVDAFLMHLRAWGFEEIRDGPDIGAFAHTRFRRGYPQLCHEMKFTVPVQDPHQAARDAAASLLLRVPSLVSNEGKDSVTISPQQQQHQVFYGATQPVFVNYRSDDILRQQQHMHQQQHGRPHYNAPIRIRSARGARRQSPNPVATGNVTTATGTTATSSATAMYSVSTRGRRNTEQPAFNNSNKRKLPLTAAPAVATDKKT